MKKRANFFIFGAFCIIVITIVGYFDTLNTYFISDHFLHLDRSGWWPSSWQSFLGVARTYPTIILSFYLKNIPLVFGLNPLGYHLVSLISHIINAILVVFLTFVISKKKHLAFFSGLVFAIHPINSEVVIWNPAISYLSSLNFYLASLLSFVLYSSSKRIKFYILAIFMFILALLSKEMMAISLPFAIIFYSVFFRNLKLKKNFFNKVKLFSPFLLVTFLYLIVIFMRYRNSISYGFMVNDAPPFHLFFAKYGLVKSALHYLSGMIVIPYKFLIFPIDEYIFLDYIIVIKSIVFIVVLMPIFLMSFLYPKKFFNRTAVYGVLMIFLSCIPVFFLLDSIYYSKGLVNSRYLYFAMIGFSMLIANTIWLIPTKKAIFRATRKGLIFGIVIFYLVLLKGNNLTWINAAEISYQIPSQTKKIHPLSAQSQEKIYFIPSSDNINNDGLRHFQGVQTYLNWERIGKAFEIEYGFPVKVCVADIDRFEWNKINQEGSIPTLTKQMLEGFDLRDIDSNSHILTWDLQENRVEDITLRIKERVNQVLNENKSILQEEEIKGLKMSLLKEEDFLYKLPLAIPLSLIDSVELKIKFYKEKYNISEIVTINLITDAGEIMPKHFTIISDGRYHIYKIPVRISEIDSLDKKVKKLELLLDWHLKKEAEIQYIDILTYNPQSFE